MVGLVRRSGSTGPMVQMLTSDSFTLVWTLPAEPSAIVRVREGEQGTPREIAVRAVKGRYEAVVDGLKAATSYRYEIELPGTQSPVFAQDEVRTAPGRNSSFRFLAFGDSGMGNEDQKALVPHMLKCDAGLVVHTGDLVYPDGKAGDYPAKFYGPYAALLRRAALYPIFGNHDYDDYLGVPMLENFVLPRNGPQGTTPERHYWFDFGDVRFVGIDNYESFEALRDQVAPWLDFVLGGAADRWKVVFFHHPVYTNSKHSPSGKILQTLVPLFDRHRVELVLCGHNHLYERSHPIRGGDIVAPGEGTVYVTTGAGGAELYRIRETPSPYMAFQNDREHSFTVVDVSPETMVLQQIGRTGQVLDRTEIPRAAKAPSTAPAAAGR